MLVRAVATFDNFCRANDPHSEHDLGAFNFDDHEVFFKIDHLDRTLTYHSPDPAVTARVITLMVAEEYLSYLSRFRPLFSVAGVCL